MLDNWQKLDFNTKYFLFQEKSEPSSTKNRYMYILVYYVQMLIFSL